jgi:hypothetical protein
MDVTGSVPHFELDINIDGIQIFKNSEQSSSVIPILGRIHSVSPNFQCACDKVIFDDSLPFVIGFYNGKKDPNPKEFLARLIDELVRLSPDHSIASNTANRPCTVMLRVVIADSPMRSYLKRTKGHSGFYACDRCKQRGVKVDNITRYEEVNATRRTDDLFLTYFKTESNGDEHIVDPSDVSPFIKLKFPMVSGFTAEVMHTLYSGTFGRRLEGLYSVRNEGKLGTNQLATVNQRLKRFRVCLLYEFDRPVRQLSSCANYKAHELRQFLYYQLYPAFRGVVSTNDLNHLLLLQYSMLLLGGFGHQPVPDADIDEATTALKAYSSGLQERQIPCRFLNHYITHLPEDVKNFQCGIESLSAFPFESFMKVFRQLTRSGHLLAEQIRNRLVERSKYLLPSNEDGDLLTGKEFINLNKEKKILFKARGTKRPKTLTFPNFKISNRFPNNFCFLNNSNIFVCTDILKYPTKSSKYRLIGHTFRQIEDAFLEPFRSSRFNIYITSKLNESTYECDESNIVAKMYPFPMSLNVPVDICSKKQRWFVSQLHHTKMN